MKCSHNFVGFLFALLFATLVAPWIATAQEKPEEQKGDKPKVDGRPVFIVNRTLIVHPESMEASPKGYKGVLGVAPLTVIKSEGKIAAEFYSAGLDGTSVSESKEMAKSAKDESNKIELVSQESIKRDDEVIEVVVLRFNLESKLGKPWIVHSVYLPRDKQCVTFKLVTSEDSYKKMLPYFQAMLFLDREKPKNRPEQERPN